ncbi:DUF5675 family protein [Roseococcus pinisoli]|uniref:DUF5675 domain-containing protein n=1 Tax=Roseococcus pinisoli TaxID=2835040 RepID=A0ABS5Q8R6_9PROT|nr:DUF5675 family protein [Roseococcus pinisoli]MBS7810105.1 hypothetical protein [Roseococcus pinisoli]
MDLLLTRQVIAGEATIGTLEIDGEFQCHTLEDLERSKKIHGKTAIPPGSYRLTLEESPRLSDRYAKQGRSRLIPRLHDVQNFSGILIHIGNKPEDTDGCILVGSWKPGLKGYIASSGKAYDALHAKLSKATSLRITVKNHMAEAEARMRHPPKVLFESVRRPPGYCQFFDSFSM